MIVTKGGLFGGCRISSRRDRMIVAWHEVPGIGKKQPVPEGRLKMSGPARFFVNFALAQNQASLRDRILVTLICPLP